MLVFGPAAPASAGTLNVAITPIDSTDNSVITSIADGQHFNRITYEVQFSCAATSCDDAEVKLSPSQPDPLGLLPAGRYLLSYETFVPPVGGSQSDISGTDQTGKTVSLGNLAAGQSGNFRVTYLIQGDQYRRVPYGSLYPDGFQIEMAATLSSSNSTSVTANASPVTWHVALPSGPEASIVTAATSEPDTTVSYLLPMTPGNMLYGGGNAGVWGDASYQAPGNYTVVFHLPPEAEFVSTNLEGVYNAVDHTITWQQGTLANPIYGARGGWGINRTSGFNGGGASTENPAGSTLSNDYSYLLYRTVELRFPASNFPAADANGCNFSANVTSQLDVTVNYLDTARTQRSVSVPRTVKVACWDPFVGVDTIKYINGAAAWVNPIYYVNVPAPGNPPLTVPYWYVQVSNRGNIPAVAVVDEPNLSQVDHEVYEIWPSGIGGTVEWTLSDGTSGSTYRNSNQVLTAPGNLYYTSAKVTTDPIPAGRVEPTDTTERTVYVDFRFRTKDDAPLGEQRTNTANVSVSYPGHTGPINHYSGTQVNLPLTSTVSRTLQYSRPSPAITAAFAGAPVVAGPQLTPGTQVTYTARATTATIWPGTTIRPQYVYVAPIGWNVTPGSASLAAGAVPGVTFDYRTVTIGGVSRSVVVATWPSSITPSTTATETWPDLTVQASPTATASTAPNAATALIWAGDASGFLSDSIGNQAFATASNQFRAYASTAVDTGDVDQDGNTTEEFAQAISAGLTVFGSSGLQVVKELCIVPDAAAPGGCATWSADTTTPHAVPVNVDKVTYRVTITNQGTVALNNVVAYDVLPHVGDTSLTVDATPRGSQFPLAIESVTAGPGVTMAYSASTNPSRPEVNPGATGTVDDWNAVAAGKVAARMTVGTLAGGQSRQVTMVAALTGVGQPDQRACNSVAIDSGSTLPTEPTPVCLKLAEADLQVELTSFANLQAGRPTRLAYTVTNNGGSAEAPASVEIEVPAGLILTDLDVDDWQCGVVGGGTAPVNGPATLNCVPVDGSAQPRLLQRGRAEELSFPVVVDVDDGQLCSSAEVTGPVYDPVLANNTDDGCQQVSPPPAGLTLSKDDGQTATAVGAQYTYTITVNNTLLAETVEDAEVTDTLPASLEYVSSSPAATVNGQDLSWTIDSLAPLASRTVQVTVRVLPGAASPVVNEANVSAPDPGFPNETLEDSDEDSNVLLTLSLDKTSDARASGVREGDVVTYTVTATGDPAGDYAGARITDDLSDVLDDATFVAGSASLSIDGGAAVAVADPVGDLLSWTGTIPAGAVATLTYQVTVGAPGNGELVNTAGTASGGSDCDPQTGLDDDGLPCVVLSTPFAPTVAKSVESVTQGDDGQWTIVYEIDVENPSTTDADYDLADTLRFGSGITASNAEVTTAPAGVTPQPWTGSGDIAVGQSVPGGGVHTYVLTVAADAGTAPGTAAAACANGAAGGFGNLATLTLGDATEVTAEACASPAEPSVTKELVGVPVKDATTGRWTVAYRVAVTNDAASPAGGLAYSLEDELEFPTGAVVHAITVTPTGGAAANPDFTGGLAELDGSAVTADAALTDGAVRIAAASGGSPTVHQYLVEVEVSVPVGAVPAELVSCGPAGAGYGNWVALLAGDTELGRATACADIRLPQLQFTKTAETPTGTRPGDRINYTIVATNVGDADFTAGDPAELVDDMSGVLDDASYLDNASASTGTVLWQPPQLSWTGPLAAGESVEIRYSVSLGEGTGDGDVVNQVSLPGTDPGDEVPTCADTPAGNAGASACQVVLEATAAEEPTDPDDELPVTGASLAGLVLLAALSIGAGAFLVRRRRSSAS
ncbi:MAG: LPXTG cell wall anchor domain-containing protein [Propionicimonas sp.]